MKRYQMYLDPSSIAVIDEFENYAKISRSKLIRETIDRFACNLAQLMAKTEELPKKKYILDELIGIINLTKKKTSTNFAQKEDIYYLSD